MKWLRDQRVEKLNRQLRQLKSELEAEQLRRQVIEAERDSLAAALARDRERIRAEIAAYARQRAESEGVNHDGSEQSPVRRFA